IYPFAAARIIESNFFMASTFFYLAKVLWGKPFLFAKRKGSTFPKIGIVKRLILFRSSQITVFKPTFYDAHDCL
ncbi:MAG: hypothetical protein II180_10450, partial [Proteobacteria bacterium]|nr:hypothetical protein [Pseudomonadota bacterium]